MDEHDQPPAELRGFDSYEVRLGDELRGHRATKGKSLLDVQRDLRIRATYIDAIENCDATVIPNKGFVAGYVRAYARYLGLDADEIYARFCAESGFKKVNGGGEGSRAPSRGPVLGGSAARDPALARNHFASPVGRAPRIGMAINLSAVASVATVAALIGGIGWGGLMLLRDVQRVQFAPSPEAPDVAEAPPNVGVPSLSFSALAESALSGEPDREEALIALYAAQEDAPPPVTPRDGPIAAVDPSVAGLFARHPPARSEPPSTRTTLAAAPAPDAPMDATPPPAATPDADVADTAAAPPEGVWILVADTAWMRVTDRRGTALVERIFEPGERWRVPEGADAPELRAGNAGGVYLMVEGEVRGPIGAPGAVVKRIALTAPEVVAEHDLAGPRVPDTLRAELEPER